MNFTFSCDGPYISARAAGEAKPGFSYLTLEIGMMEESFLVADALLGAFGIGEHIKVSGEIRYRKFGKETSRVFNVTNIQKAEVTRLKTA